MSYFKFVNLGDVEEYIDLIVCSNNNEKNQYLVFQLQDVNSLGIFLK